MLSDEEIKTVKQEIALWQGKLYEIPVGQIEEEKTLFQLVLTESIF